ncbi:MAG: serine protease [Clostridia bacterium]|nr:serine protease [Clostridia bacterium]
MGFICKTCGGECTAVNTSATAATYKCVCCGNVYIVKNGEQAFGGDAFQKPIKREESVIPRTMPEQTAKSRLSAEEVFDKNISSVLELRSSYGGKQYSGSGYSVGSGYAVTNAHVVMKNGKIVQGIKAYVCGKTYTAEVVKTDAAEDLALIRVNGAPPDMKAVKFADISKLRNGQTLYVIGNSLGGGTCITSGIVSDKRRLVGGKPRLMTDCAVNKGNSGGPVFNDSGEVVGTVAAVTTAAEGMNYAIPADIVLKFLS